MPSLLGNFQFFLVYPLTSAVFCTFRSKFDRNLRPWSPVYTHPIPRDYDLERPPHDGYIHPPRFLNQPHDAQYGIRDSSSKLLW